MKKLSFIFSLYLYLTSSMVMAEFVSEQDQIIQQREKIRNNHFKNINELVELRAPGLALNYVRREQAAYNQDDPTEWLYWEQKHISLLSYTQQWELLDQRVNQQLEKLRVPKVATADRNWFLTEQIRALIKLKKYPIALKKLRALLWNTTGLTKTTTIASWRRLVIQIYLNQNELNDAQVAMRRYQQDYGDLHNEDGVSWLQIQAELYIQSEQYKAAILLLKHAKSDEASALSLLAELKAGSVSAAEAINRTESMLIVNTDQRNQALYEYVSLVAAIQGNKIDVIIQRLEFLLSLKKIYLSNSVLSIGGVAVTADNLWAYYLQLGNQLANDKGLLRGDDEAWYALANNLFKSDVLNSKGLLASLSLQATHPKHRNLAMQQLVSLIEQDEKSLQLVNRLFTESKHFLGVELIPTEVRYRLIDYNLSLGSVKSAAILMDELEQPPADQDQFAWNMRRSRVFILNGDFEQGANVLNEILESKQLESTQIDKFIQVVFDLQAVEQHQKSLELFSKLESQVEDADVLRELIFWKAESYHGMQQYEQAAYLFLKSSISPKREYDPWYHTATFRAAESLVSAKLYEDARQRFLHLLSITGNAARKTVIRQRLQSIRLNQQVQ